MAQIFSNQLSGFIPTDIANDIIADVTRGSAVMALSKFEPMSTPEKTVPVMTEGAGAYWVGEGEKIQTSKAEWIFPKLTAKKLGVIIPVTRESLNDTTINVFESIKPTIAEAFAVAFDKAALFGENSPYGAGLSLIEKAAAAGQEFIFGSVPGQEIGGDLSDLMALVEEAGYDVNAFAGPVAMKNSLRKAKDDNGNAIFTDITKDAPAQVYGSPLAYARNGAWDKTVAKLVAGNFNYSLVGVLEGIEYRVSEDATVGDINLFEQDMVALRATMRIGFLIVKDEAFAVLK